LDRTDGIRSSVEAVANDLQALPSRRTDTQRAGFPLMNGHVER
jgi:hypothetical protein